MGVFIRRTAAGISPYWFGRWEEDGKRRETSLCRWKGVPPEPGQKRGDADFEKSRGEAEAAFKRIREGERSREEEAALIRKIHASRYGGKVDRVKIAELAERWDALPHKADLTSERRDRVHSVLRRFADFMGERFPKVKEAGALTAEHFKAFFADVDKHGIPRKDANGKDGTGKKAAPRKEKGGVSARTWNDVLDILRGVLRKVDGQGVGFREYLANLPKRAENTIHRRPFTGEELEAVFAAAREVDPELFPVIVAAACTALRRGDVARLRWDALDMDAGFATVKTTKTGETVEIPIFPPFMAVLREAEGKRRRGVPYVFPEIALAYKAGPGELDRRLRKVLAAAGFVRPERATGGKYPAPPSPADAVAMVDAGMRGARWSEARRQKGLAILQRHLNGEDGRTIAAAMGIARGAVSTYLHDMETLGEIALVSPAKPATPALPTLAEMKDGEQRRNRGSLCGWHSFRTTFCSLALANGVPMEELTRITGHRTAAIVEKHYNQAKREQSRKTFGTAMPKALVGAVEGAEGLAAGAAKHDGPVELEAVPADVAKLARMLAQASPSQLEAVAAILSPKAKGSRGKAGKRKNRG